MSRPRYGEPPTIETPLLQHDNDLGILLVLDDEDYSLNERPKTPTTNPELSEEVDQAPSPEYNLEYVRGVNGLSSKNLHPVSLILNVVALGLFIGFMYVQLAWMRLEAAGDPGAAVQYSYRFMLGVLCGFFYLVYFNHAWWMATKSNSYISKLNNPLPFRKAEDFFRDMIAASPSVSHSIRCFRTELITAGEGSSKETHAFKRVSYEEQVICPIGSVVLDKSPPPVALQLLGKQLGWFVNVNIKKSFTVIDPAVSIAMDLHMSKCEARNRLRDECYEITTNVDIPGYVPKLLFVPDDTHWGLQLTGTRVYLASALLFMGWPYLIFIEMVSCRVDWVCHKEIGMRQAECRE